MIEQSLILAAQIDEIAFLVYTDWLEEQGRSDEAEYLRHHEDQSSYSDGNDNNVRGYGMGDGYGYGYGDGSGDGYYDGNGFGDGCGYGDGIGNGGGYGWRSGG